ncbi:RagB/SusD family nutrient uptake outer membrane protein [Flavobacterium hydatis]|jgi:hypothetical protein|uniref:RagB/SusD family nutrient uptake outer membrane protein n=1 Tax=Flavobacterium hydatis TaxID=991 RepID=A0A086AIL7_FLAHY|nr:RagB/SusD family nutrient uptake outer membrane protein [Flavobacterium hydatis]KFF16531.1 starch-binding protein [Flavobacterium hydatis]OXA93927.1 RagB/SusD family nutrient uptake outer membrane protein [Flavobacterium hydatis]
MKTKYKKQCMNCCWSVFIKIVFLSTVFSMPACDSFLEVELPKSQLTNSTVFQDYTTANAAMADVYSKMRDKGLLTGSQFGISNQLGNYTDEFTFYGAPTNATSEFYANTILPSNSTLELFWNNSYNQIYASNAVLEGVQTAPFSTQDKAQLQGEALFIRALLHFYLLQLFGDIPYIQTTDYKVNSTVTRMTSNEIYAHIITDLKTAEALLPSSYSTTERVRANSFVVKALLARVYLYTGSWEDANEMATAVINNNSLYVFENNLDKVFLKNSTETIWQFMPTVAGKNTDDAIVFNFTLGPPPLVAITESLINSFTINDLRKSHWTKEVSNRIGTWYSPYKYKESRNTSVSREYTIILRLTEQYLIRAEALAQKGNLIVAKEDLNKIRKRAGLSDIEASSKEEILEAILQERRKELFSEYGHRFFDLKRASKLDLILSTKSGWNTNDKLLPIPKSELSANPNLTPQNPGY